MTAAHDLGTENAVVPDADGCEVATQFQHKAVSAILYKNLKICTKYSNYILNGS